jgi:alpha-galactosidase
MCAMTSIAFLGAGSVEFTRDLLADLLRFDDLGDIEVRLHDIDADRLATADGIAASVASQLGASPKVTVHPDRRSALDGVDFAINMIQVGGLAATKTDFAVANLRGVRQTIADTLGIGAIFRGLRTFPVLAGIADDMLDLCPDAYLLNYTNPMSMNISYLATVAPALKAVGLCHSVHWTVHGLCEDIGVPFDEVTWSSAGVNHQAWLLRWERAGESLYPLLDERIAADPQLQRRVRVDMYRRLGFYPTETSEHSSEYVPWYLQHDGEIERLRIEPDVYVGISEANVATYEETRRALGAGESLALEPSATEYAPQVVHSMVTGTKRRIEGNVANTGLITNLPAGLAVEVPCLVDELGVHPTYVGDLPPQCAALNRAFLNVVDLTVRAGVEGDPRLVRQAAMVDPNTAATLTLDDIWGLCNDLVAAHGDLLPEPLRGSLDI